jgi:hypothetical protein
MQPVVTDQTVSTIGDSIGCALGCPLERLEISFPPDTLPTQVEQESRDGALADTNLYETTRPQPT